MKTLILSVIFGLMLNQGFSQSIETKNSVGADFIAAFAVLFGNNDQLQVIEVTYYRHLPKIDLRTKLNINANDFMQKETVYSKTIDPVNEITYNTTYSALRNYVLSLGVAKKLKVRNFNYYVGVDTNFGLNAGYTDSFVNDNLDEENSFYANSTKTKSYIIGLTPVFGSTIKIDQRISLAIEFGIPINYNFGNVDYLTETETLEQEFVKRTDIGFDRLLNDVRISYNF